MHSLCILGSSHFHLFRLKRRKSFPIFKYESLLVFQRHNINHGTRLPMISYHHNSLVYWKIISSTEVKARVTVLQYCFTEN